MTDSATLAFSVRDAPDAARHPAGVPVLFFTEMWERFSYYGMRALLVLYLVGPLDYARADALALYGTYTGLVYLTPIFGGWLADRYLGYRKAILIGGIVLAAGHFAMAFPPLLAPALGLLVAGNGFFKPNISTLLGALYRERDPRRDGGFTIFYMGINLGALLAPLVAGTLGEKIGWHWGFASAGVIAAWGAFGAIWSGLGTRIKIAVPVAAFIGFLAWQRRSCSREEWHRVLAIAVIGACVIFFWMGFEQAGGTMSLFADRQTDRMLFGREIPASYFQSVNPLLIVLLGPLFALMWRRWDRSRFALPAPAKMGLGMIVLGAGFVVLAIAQDRADSLGKVGPQWLSRACSPARGSRSTGFSWEAPRGRARCCSSPRRCWGG